MGGRDELDEGAPVDQAHAGQRRKRLPGLWVICVSLCLPAATVLPLLPFLTLAGYAILVPSALLLVSFAVALWKRSRWTPWVMNAAAGGFVGLAALSLFEPLERTFNIVQDFEGWFQFWGNLAAFPVAFLASVVAGYLWFRRRYFAVGNRNSTICKTSPEGAVFCLLLFAALVGAWAYVDDDPDPRLRDIPKCETPDAEDNGFFMLEQINLIPEPDYPECCRCWSRLWADTPLSAEARVLLGDWLDGQAEAFPVIEKALAYPDIWDTGSEGHLTSCVGRASGLILESFAFLRRAGRIPEAAHLVQLKARFGQKSSEAGYVASACLMAQSLARAAGREPVDFAFLLSVAEDEQPFLDEIARSVVWDPDESIEMCTGEKPYTPVIMEFWWAGVVLEKPVLVKPQMTKNLLRKINARLHEGVARGELPPHWSRDEWYYVEALGLREVMLYMPPGMLAYFDVSPGLDGWVRNPLGTVLAAMMAYVQTEQAERGFRGLALIRQTRLFLALREYYLVTGSLPETLDELVPRYIGEVPKCPFSGKPMIYERDGAGPLLRSVGPDRVQGDSLFPVDEDDDDDIVIPLDFLPDPRLRRPADWLPWYDPMRL